MLLKTDWGIGVRQGIKPEPDLNLVDWAERFFVLPQESTNEYGPWRSIRVPYLVDPLKRLSWNDPTQFVVVIKPTQSGATTAGIIVLLGYADYSPCPCLVILPTGDLAEEYSKEKLGPSIPLCSRLKNKIHDPRSRKAGNTILSKLFPGGSWKLKGSNSPAGYRSKSVRVLVLDDFDGFDTSIGKEGDPFELADRRTSTFASNRKIYINSTTTLKDTSNVERVFEETTQEYFNLPCPHCDGFQYFKFGGVDSEFGIKFTRTAEGEISEVWYECEHCHKRIDEYQKNEMLSGAKYIAKYPKREKRGYRWNALVVPIGMGYTWKQIVEKFLSAKKELKSGKPEKMISFMNTILSEPWEDTGDQPEWELLYARCEPYQPFTVPKYAYLLVAGVDVQDNRLAVKLDAFGEGEECATVYYTELWGDPERPEVWGLLDQVINRQYLHESGLTLSVVSVAIDSGGHNTQAVYNYCRSRQPRVFAIKGSSQPGRPILGKPKSIDVTWKGKTIKSGAQLWLLGTDTAKSLIYNRLAITTPGPGYMHFYIGLEEDFFKQLTAEKRVTRIVKGYAKSEWVQTQPRNEVLDCTVYAYAAAIKAGLPVMDWQRLKKQFEDAKESGAQSQKPKRRIISKGVEL